MTAAPAGLGKKRKLKILDICAALTRACVEVRDLDDFMRYLKRAYNGFLKALGPNHDKTIRMTEACFTLASDLGDPRETDKQANALRDLAKRAERALGAQHEVTLDVL